MRSEGYGQARSLKSRREEKTKVPGVFRRGGRYVVRFRDPQGRLRRRSARTLAEARDLKAALTADVARGEYRALSGVSFVEYAPEWIASYAGRTTRGFREETRREYRRALGLDDDGRPTGSGAVAFFGRMRLSEIEPRDMKRYVGELMATGLATGTVRKTLAPVRALLATAVEDGLIRSNPAARIRIPRPASGISEDEKAKALTGSELRRLLVAVPAEWRLFVEFLACTGLRFSEAIGLEWRDVDFGRRRIRVRRRIYRGVDEPKSRFARRDVPISAATTQRLWTLRKDSPFHADGDPVFASRVGTPLDYKNLYDRMLKPAVKKAGVPWAAFHTFRHTCATNLFREGLNPKQVQLWLGHHSAAFTLDTYVHLLPDDLPDPVFFDDLARERGEQTGEQDTPKATETESSADTAEAVA